MTKAGLAAFEAREEERTGLYSFERPSVDLPPAYSQLLQSNVDAWEYYQQRPASYRRITTYWVMSAKREETRDRRLATLVDCCAKRTPIPPMRREKP